jgi:hypothetical protein
MSEILQPKQRRKIGFRPMRKTGPNQRTNQGDPSPNQLANKSGADLSPARRYAIRNSASRRVRRFVIGPHPLKRYALWGHGPSHPVLLRRASVSGRSFFSRLLIYENGNVLSEALHEILFVVLDIVSVAESADQFCSRALGCQTVQCNRSAFACPQRYYGCLLAQL